MSNQLQNLKSKGEVTYELKDQAYCYMIFKGPVDFSSLSAHLTIWLSEVESCKVRRLDAMFKAAMFAVYSREKLHGCCLLIHIKVFLQSNSRAKFTPSCKLQARLILPHIGQKPTLGKVHKNRLPRRDGSSKGRTD